MEEKQKKDKSLLVIILVGILVIALGALIIYNYRLNEELSLTKAQTPTKVNELKQEENTIKEEKAETKKVKKLDNSKELVYTLASKKSKKNDYSFEIPYINIDSEYAKETNNKIQKKYSNLDKLAKEATEYPADSLGVVKYKAYTNNNILSLVITEGSIIDEYYVYNIDIYTGKKVSNEEILKTKNVSESKFLNKVEELCTNAINEIYKNSDYGSKKESLKSTIKKNKNIEIKMFLGKGNEINIIPLIYNDIAQFNEVEQIINTKL